MYPSGQTKQLAVFLSLIMQLEIEVEHFAGDPVGVLPFKHKIQSVSRGPSQVRQLWWQMPLLNMRNVLLPAFIIEKNSPFLLIEPVIESTPDFVSLNIEV